MLLNVTLLIASFLVILGGCEFFSNGVEWTGKKMRWAEGVVGSVLAAVGTALPETLIPIIAILFHSDEAGHAVGIGAILGAPFMLSTLTLMIVGIAIFIASFYLKRRDNCLNIDVRAIKRDNYFFLIIFSIAIFTSFFKTHALKSVVAIFLFLSYFYYLYISFKQEGIVNDDVNPLYFARESISPRMKIILWQVICGLAGIVIGAHYFIIFVTKVAADLKISPLILSMIITPIVTELPEKMNSVLWVLKGKDTLALGNITGALVFQGCIPVAFGMFFTPWKIEGITLMSSAMALISSLIFYILLGTKKKVSSFHMMFLGLFYILFIIYLVINF